MSNEIQKRIHHVLKCCPQTILWPDDELVELSEFIYGAIKPLIEKRENNGKNK